MKQFLLLNTILLLIIGCQQQPEPSDSHIRMLSMIPGKDGVLTIRGEEGKKYHQRQSLHYNQPTTYDNISSGHYFIAFTSGGDTLLTGHYTIGKRGYYTMVVAGLIPDHPRVNASSTLNTLKHIFAGSEIRDYNHYLPQWFMLRDNYDGSLSSGYIRIMNASPYLSPITVKSDQKKLKKGLTYPKETDMMKLKPGDHELTFLYGDITVARTSLHVEPGIVYTAVTGNDMQSKTGLSVTILKNKSRTLLSKK